MTNSSIMEFRRSGLRFVVATTGGGSRFISDYLSVPGASTSFIEGVVPYSKESTDSFLGTVPESYCSARTSRLLASAALKRARDLSRDADPSSLIGIGATASLASDRPKKGRRRIFCAVETYNVIYSASFFLGKEDRTRAQEEVLCADFITSVLTRVSRASRKESRVSFEREKLAVETEEPLCELDEATIEIAAFAPKDREALTRLCSTTSRDGENARGALRWTAGRVDLARKFDGEEVPFAADATLEVGVARALFPGSFNPPHRAHLAIASLASQHTGVPTEFELSVCNVDKPPLEPFEIARRLAALADACPESSVWTTNAPRFVEKATLFPNATFALGTDTVLRLADPKYEDGSTERRDAVLSRLEELGARFIVFARRVGGKISPPETLRKELPPALSKACLLLDENVFLDDVSSTELRRGAEGRV